jgi:pentalenene oxygenase
MTDLSAIPVAPRALPLIGHTLQLLRDPLEFLGSLPTWGDVVRVRIGPVSAVVVCDPGLTRQVLLDDRTFDKGGPLIDRAREVLGDGLATCPHSRHRRLRRWVQPAFHPARLAGYAEAFSACVDGVTSGWRDGQVVDVVHEMQVLTARITVETMFSGVLRGDTLRDALDDLITVCTGWYRRMFLPRAWHRLPTAGNRRYDHARTGLHRTLRRIVVDRRADGSDHGDLLSVLVAIHEGDRLSDTDVVDELVTFFVGGTETTAAALAWALYELAREPDLEDRLHTEADAVLAGRVARHDDLPELELTRRVVTETLRRWPPGWVVTRTTRTHTRLGEYPIPPGTTVVYSPYLIHHRADLHPDPGRFDPDRWLPEHAGTRTRDTLIPFGGGARKCVGDQFATTAAVLALATIATRWRLSPLPGRRVRPAIGTFLNPRELRMRVTARRTAHVKDCLS